MDTEALPPIPTPPGQRWREFRISILPPFIFIAVLAALFMLWTNFVQPVAIVGMVETNAVNIVTTQAGLLTTLAVNRFDDVTNGQVIGEVAPYDPEQLKAELAAIASTAAVKDAQAGVLEWGKLDNAIAMRLNLIAHQISVDAARIKFVQASNVVAIDERLRVGTNYVVTDAAYQAHLADREALKTEWLAQAKTVQLSTNALDHIEGVASNIFAHLDLTLKEDVLKQQKQLLELQKPLVFKAPIDGKITAVLHRAGERVVAGAPLVTISSTRAQQIVAFVRQPINFHPKVGDILTIRTRNTRRRTSEAQIVKVGSQLEPVNPLLLPIYPPRPELGLAIALSLPPELNLLPGEFVDIKFSKN